MSVSPASLEQNDDLEAVLRGDDATASTFLRLLPHSADVVDVLRVVEVKEWPRLLRLVPNDAMRAEAVALLEESERAALLGRLPPGEIGNLVQHLETDDAADVIEELDPREQRAALGTLAPDVRAHVEQLLQYGHDTAGGLMQVERAQVNRKATVADAVAAVRALVERDIGVHNVFVVDDEDHLVGTIDMAQLLLSDHARPIAEVIMPPVAKVTTDVDQEQVAAIFRKYSAVVLPVVDREGRMIGRILHDDIVHVIVEEAEEDALKQAGTSAKELLYRDRVFPVVRIRLPWLVTTLFGSLVSAAALYAYQPVLTHFVLLTCFIPLIAALSGSVGAQTATIVSRGLASGRVNGSELSSLAFRELRVGLLLGAACGVVAAGVATLLFDYANAALGVVVFAAMTASLTASAVLGVLVPAAMKKLGVDPAIASGPFIATLSDVVSIVVYLSIALVALAPAP